jgi:signal peptidase I
MEERDFLICDEPISQAETETAHIKEPADNSDRTAEADQPQQLSEIYIVESMPVSKELETNSDHSELLNLPTETDQPAPVVDHSNSIQEQIPPQQLAEIISEQFEDPAPMLESLPEPESTPLPLFTAPSTETADPAPKLAMPQFYVQTSSLRARGILPGDDLQIEVILPEKEPSRTRIWFTEVRALLRDFFFAAVTALLIVIFVVQPVKVEGTSMLPRLHDGERIFVNKFIYQFESIKRGDIVVFWYPKNPSQSFIKRVIGLPGDEVRITNGKLYINNKLVPEPYLSPEFSSNIMPNRYWIVDEHHYFVMGDNRDASNDSRSWGQVPEKYIYGKAIFRYWPLESAGTLSDISD